MSSQGPVAEQPGPPGATVRVWVTLGDGYAQHTDAVLDAAGWHPLVLRWRGVAYVQAPDIDQYPGIRRYWPQAEELTLW